MWHEEYNLFGIKNHILQKKVEVIRYRRIYRASVIIQKCFRGYITRKHLKKLHEKAIIIQKNWRGTMVRRGIDSFLSEVGRAQLADFYSLAALKLQRHWKFCVALRLFHVHQMRRNAERSIMEKVPEYNNQQKLQIEREARTEFQSWLEYMLSKAHHLLRTKCIPGVYSLTGSDELSPIEECLSKLKFKDFLSNLKEERELVFLKLMEKRIDILPHFTEVEKLFYSRHCLRNISVK